MAKIITAKEVLRSLVCSMVKNIVFNFLHSRFLTKNTPKELRKMTSEATLER